MTPADVLRRSLDNTELRAAAIKHLESLLIDLDVEEIPEDGSYTYDDNAGTAERFMLEGGGPSAWAVFVEFSTDDLMGYFEYADSTGTTIVHIPEQVLPDLRSALRRDANARNARR